MFSFSDPPMCSRQISGCLNILFFGESPYSFLWGRGRELGSSNLTVAEAEGQELGALAGCPVAGEPFVVGCLVRQVGDNWRGGKKTKTDPPRYLEKGCVDAAFCGFHLFCLYPLARCPLPATHPECGRMDAVLFSQTVGHAHGKARSGRG